MFRGLMYGSFKNPRELCGIFGMLILPVSDGRSLLRLPAAVGEQCRTGARM